MRMRTWLWLFLAGALLARAEIIDRIAVTVDKLVITESDIIRHIRVAAFLNQKPADFTAAGKREAASRVAEQVLVRREMEISRYPAPDFEEIEPLLAQVREDRYADLETYHQGLNNYGVTELELRENLLLQLTLLRFIEYRFRPGVAISDEEIEKYYEEEFLPRSQNPGPDGPTPLEDARDDIEEILIGRQVDVALDRWLEQAASQARINYREEIFQ